MLGSLVRQKENKEKSRGSDTWVRCPDGPQGVCPQVGNNIPGWRGEASTQPEKHLDILGCNKRKGTCFLKLTSFKAASCCFYPNTTSFQKGLNWIFTHFKWLVYALQWEFHFALQLWEQAFCKGEQGKVSLLIDLVFICSYLLSVFSPFFSCPAQQPLEGSEHIQWICSFYVMPALWLSPQVFLVVHVLSSK